MAVTVRWASGAGAWGRGRRRRRPGLGAFLALRPLRGRAAAPSLAAAARHRPLAALVQRRPTPPRTPRPLKPHLLLAVGLRVVRLHAAQVAQVALVAHQHDHDVAVRMVAQLLEPPLDVLKRHCAARAAGRRGKVRRSGLAAAALTPTSSRPLLAPLAPAPSRPQQRPCPLPQPPLRSIPHSRPRLQAQGQPPAPRPTPPNAPPDLVMSYTSSAPTAPR
jgi:hypothetical protein